MTRPHPRIMARRIAVQIEQDVRLWRRLEQLGLDLPAWMDIQDRHPEIAAALEDLLRRGSLPPAQSGKRHRL